jgi:WxcM-like, C-terminal.
MIPKIISGGKVYDNRGSLRFSNKLIFKKIKRFYIVHNYSKNFIRAWHGTFERRKI